MTLGQHAPDSTAQASTDVDAVVIGAGFSGLYALHKLRNEMGLRVQVFETGGGVGGTWYWNRYPGARSDSPSYIYGYTFDEELWQEWEWSERYPQQDEIRAYLEHVAERYDLNRDISFNTRVTGATFDEATNAWTVTTDGGESRHREVPDHGRRRAVRLEHPGVPRPATPSRATPTTPGAGRTRASTSPGSASGSSAPVPAPCRPPR